MRWILVAALGLVPAYAEADDIAVGAAVGAGGQGDTGYGALELRLDAEWRGIRIGLGGRAVLEGRAVRTREWSRPVDAIAILRQLEAHAGPVALAAGALAPATIGRVADGYRVTLDDRARTGARVVLVTRGLERARNSTGDGRASARDDGRASVRDGGASARDAGDASGHDGRRARDDGRDRIALEASAEIDDVLDPALVGGALAWQVIPAWGLRAATAVDPRTSRVAMEVGTARRWERDDARVELGASLVGERWQHRPATGPTSRERGLGVVGFASAAIDRANARGLTRWTIAVDVRAGNGTNGAAFGPLYRVERAPLVDPAASTDCAMSTSAPSCAILDDARTGVGAGLTGSVASDAGWLSIGGRHRPGLGPLGTFSAGAPMGRRLQAGAWLAASPRATAGAAEVRAVWGTHFYTSFQMARMYTDAPGSMTSDFVAPLAPAWSATVWFGASTR